jgi:hypothetical protein
MEADRRWLPQISHLTLGHLSEIFMEKVLFDTDSIVSSVLQPINIFHVEIEQLNGKR